MNAHCGENALPPHSPHHQLKLKVLPRARYDRGQVVLCVLSTNIACTKQMPPPPHPPTPIFGSKSCKCPRAFTPHFTVIVLAQIWTAPVRLHSHRCQEQIRQYGHEHHIHTGLCLKHTYLDIFVIHKAAKYQHELGHGG